MDIDEPEMTHVYAVDPEMIYAMPLSEDEIKIYLNENETVSFSRYAAQLIYEILGKFLAV